MAMSTEKIVQDEKAQLDFSKSMSYGDYLHLDEVLGAQHPRSPAHDEMLFIIQHQTSELWMKLMLHELHGATRCIAANQLPDAFKMLARVSRIMEQLVSAWTVLSTMTPPEYTAMRPYLASSSGFQSAQYRCIEFALGNKNAAMLKPHAHRADLLAQVEAAYRAPSLYDESLRWRCPLRGRDVDGHDEEHQRVDHRAEEDRVVDQVHVALRMARQPEAIAHRVEHEHQEDEEIRHHHEAAPELPAAGPPGGARASAPRHRFDCSGCRHDCLESLPAEEGAGAQLGAPATVLMRAIISSTALSTGTFSLTTRFIALAHTFSLFSTVNL